MESVASTSKIHKRITVDLSREDCQIIYVDKDKDNIMLFREDPIERLKLMLDFLKIEFGILSHASFKNCTQPTIRTELKSQLSQIPGVLHEIIESYTTSICSGGCMHVSIDIREKHWNSSTPLYRRSQCGHLFHELCLRSNWLRFIENETSAYAHRSDLSKTVVMRRDFQSTRLETDFNLVDSKLVLNERDRNSFDSIKELLIKKTYTRFVPSNFCPVCYRNYRVFERSNTSPEILPYWTPYLYHYSNDRHMPLAYALHLPIHLVKVGQWIDVHSDRWTAPGSSSDWIRGRMLLVDEIGTHGFHSIWIGYLYGSGATVVPRRFWMQMGQSHYINFGSDIDFQVTDKCELKFNPTITDYCPEATLTKKLTRMPVRWFTLDKETKRSVEKRPNYQCHDVIVGRQDDGPRPSYGYKSRYSMDDSTDVVAMKSVQDEIEFMRKWMLGPSTIVNITPSPSSSSSSSLTKSSSPLHFPIDISNGKIHHSRQADDDDDDINHRNSKRTRRDD